MKKAIAIVLAGICLLSAILVVPALVQGAGTSADRCFNRYDRCRAKAFNMDVSWVKMALVLTACDLALGRCIYLG